MIQLIENNARKKHEVKKGAWGKMSHYVST
jgi:hypothetical protein